VDDAVNARSLADRYWDEILELEPLLGTATGDPRFDDKLPDVGEGTAKRGSVTSVQAIFGTQMNIGQGIQAMLVKRVAEGAENVEVPHTDRADEIGALARAIQIFQEAMDRNRNLNSQILLDSRSREERAQHIETSVEAFRGAIGTVLQTIGLGPHRANLPNRPPWFFQRERYGGIITDIASHQVDLARQRSVQREAPRIARLSRSWSGGGEPSIGMPTVISVSPAEDRLRVLVSNVAAALLTRSKLLPSLA
jgi:hypothetical protein